MEEISKRTIDDQIVTVSVRDAEVVVQTENATLGYNHTLMVDEEQASVLARDIEQAASTARSNQADANRKAQLSRDRHNRLKELEDDFSAYDNLEEKPKDEAGKEIPFEPSKQAELDHLRQLMADGEL